MHHDTAHLSAWRTADVVFGAALLLGIAGHFVIPLTFAPYLDRELLHYIGTPLLVCGMIVVILAQKELLNHDQPSRPAQATTQIVTTGIFNYSRNPLYLGVLIAFVGLAMATDSPWWLLLFVPVAAVT
ncbi:MAG: hypothetical protein FD130_2459, partial [Halothiobacillaceae bacterium]